MIHICLQEVIDGLEGIFVGGGIEIQGAPQEVFGRISDEELVSCGCIPPYVEKDASYPIGCLDRGLINGGGLVGVLEGHLKGVIPQLVESVVSDILIADVDLCVKAGEIDVDPIRVFRLCLEESAVLHHIRVHGVFEGIGVARLIESAIFVPGQVDLEIPSPPGIIVAVTGRKKGQCCEGDPGGLEYSFFQFKDSFLR